MLVDTKGNPIAGLCHYSLRNIPVPGAVNPNSLELQPIPVPCMKISCVNWDQERNKCGDIVMRELLAQLLEKKT